MSRHRWGDKVVFPRKSERDCANCGLVKVSRREHLGGRDQYWTEYWRDGERVEGDGKVPACEPVGVEV